MKDQKKNDEKSIRQVIYVKPILTFDQVVEIIDERIEILEYAAKEMQGKKKHKTKNKQL